MYWCGTLVHQKLIKGGLAKQSNFAFRYIDHVLLTTIRNLLNTRIAYPLELDIRGTTDTPASDSYLDLFLQLDTEGKLTISL